MPFVAIWMDLEIIRPSEVNQKKKDKSPKYHSYVESKYDTNKLIYKKESDSQIQKTNLWSPKRKGDVGGIYQELGISRYKQLYIK